MDNRNSNNTALMIVIISATIVLVILSLMLMFLMMSREKEEDVSSDQANASVTEEASTEAITEAVTVTATETSAETVTVATTTSAPVETVPTAAATVSAPVVTVPAEDTTVKYTLYVVNCNEWISLRSYASTSARRLEKIPLGASCGFIESASNGFYKVSYNGVTGYALAQYLSTERTVTRTVDSPSILYVVNCDEWISLRSSPSTSASRLKKIPLGASCEYLGSAGNGFYRVRYNGTEGYALSQYLSH